MVILTVLILQVDEHHISFRLFVSSSMTSLSILQAFQYSFFSPISLDLLLGILIFWCNYK